MERLVIALLGGCSLFVVQKILFNAVVKGVEDREAREADEEAEVPAAGRQERDKVVNERLRLLLDVDLLEEEVQVKEL